MGSRLAEDGEASVRQDPESPASTSFTCKTILPVVLAPGASLRVRVGVPGGCCLPVVAQGDPGEPVSLWLPLPPAQLTGKGARELQKANTYTK